MKYTEGRSVEIRPENQLFKKNIRLLHYLGLWPTSSGKGCYWYLIPRFTIAYEFLEVFVVRGINIIFYWAENTPGQIFVDIIFVMCIPCLLASIWNQMMHMNRADALVSRIQLIHDPPHLQDRFQRDVFVKIKKTTDVITSIPWILVICIGISSAIMVPVLIYKNETVSGGFYPFDVSAAPYLHVTVIVQAYIGVVFFPSWLAVGTFHVTMMAQTKVLFRILQHKLLRIRAHCEAALGMTSKKLLDRGVGDLERRRDSSPSDSLQVVDLDFADNTSEEVGNTEIMENILQTTYEDEHILFGEPRSIPVGNSRYRISRRTVLRSKIRRFDPESVKVTRPKAAQGIRGEQGSRSARALDMQMQRRINNCVKMHQELLRCCSEMNTTMSAFLMSSVVFCLAPSGIAILYLTMVAFNKWTIVFALGLCIEFAYLFSLCWFADQITEQSGLVGEAAYSCDWLQASDSFKKALRVIISSANHPFVFRAGGFVPITVETFHSVATKAYSYYAVLKTVARPEKHA